MLFNAEKFDWESMGIDSFGESLELHCSFCYFIFFLAVEVALIIKNHSPECIYFMKRI